MDLTGWSYAEDSEAIEAEAPEQSDTHSVYMLKRPPSLKSKYMEFLAQKAESDLLDSSASQEDKSKSEKEHLHAWVHCAIDKTQGDEGEIFIEATTGYKRKISDPSYLRISCAFNDTNYWLNLAGDKLNRSKSLNLDNDRVWLKMIQKEVKIEDDTPKYQEVGVGFMKIKKQISDPKAKKSIIQRPWDLLYSWVEPLVIDKEKFELIYRLGQKVERYFETKVEHFAPYLLKDGLVQKITKFENNSENAEEVRLICKYSNRQDKLEQREHYKLEGRVVERFARGREDKLAQIVTDTKIGPDEKIQTYTFFHKFRQDGLFQRQVTEWEFQDSYKDREDFLVALKVMFGMPEKKFGPAEEEENSRMPRKILRLVQEFALAPNVNPRESIAERMYDIENQIITLKLHREPDRILCQTVKFSRPSEGQKVLTEDDVSVYMVDPRQQPPSINELQELYRKQVKSQAVAVSMAKDVERQITALTDLRLQEESKPNLTVGLFDTKRNQRVKAGREAQEKARKERERSEIDLELDFLAPFLAKYGDTELTKQQAMQVRDNCLESIKASMEEKELELTSHLNELKTELETLKKDEETTQEDMNSKKFFINVLETRIKRHKQYAKNQYVKAEKKIRQDERLLKYLT